MSHMWKSMTVVMVAVVLGAGYTEQASAQGRRGVQIAAGQVMRSLLTSNAPGTAATTAAAGNRGRKSSAIGLAPGSLTFGGGDSSVAISLAPGAVGVAVGTKDTAVAVAVGGGGVGVGVANDKGTAVSVGAGGGGVSVGVDHSKPKYQPFGTPSLGANQNHPAANAPSFSGTGRTTLYGQRTSPRFANTATHWNFTRN